MSELTENSKNSSTFLCLRAISNPFQAQRNKYCILTNGTAVKYALNTEDVLKYTGNRVFKNIKLLDLKLMCWAHIHVYSKTLSSFKDAIYVKNVFYHMTSHLGVIKRYVLKSINQ